MSDILELNYQLAELPSPQHRAGLAGLVLMVRELQLKSWFEERENAVIELKEKEYGATLRLNLEGLKALFDLTYEPIFDPRWSTKKDKNREYREDEIREVTKEDGKGKKKVVKQYLYYQLWPRGAFLSKWDKSSEDEREKIWLRLWQDMLWNIIRGRDKARLPFKNRSNDKFYSKDAENLWKELKDPEKATGQSSSYYLGAMASTSENVQTKDIIRYQFLLNFWVFITQVYRSVNLDKEGRRDSPSSYVLAIPDVANLRRFCKAFRRLIETKSQNSKSWRFLPREAVIDLPQEGALDLMVTLRNDVVANEMGSQSIKRLILGVEVIEAEKSSNSIKIQSIDYIQPISSQTNRYEEIRKIYWCPWFRKQRLLNLLRSQPQSSDLDAPLEEITAWTGFDSLLSRIPRRYLDDPKLYFSHDARELFKKEVPKGDKKMSKPTRHYAEIVRDICYYYAIKKLETRYQIKRKKEGGFVKLGEPISNKEVEEKKEKIINEAFLAVRSRTEAQIFINYFVETLYPFVSKDEFPDFANKLFHDTNEIRALTLLALSSQFPFRKSDELSSET